MKIRLLAKSSLRERQVEDCAKLGHRFTNSNPIVRRARPKAGEKLKAAAGLG
jgi:hypothetical protein